MGLHLLHLRLDVIQATDLDELELDTAALGANLQLVLWEQVISWWVWGLVEVLTALLNWWELGNLDNWNDIRWVGWLWLSQLLEPSLNIVDGEVEALLSSLELLDGLLDGLVVDLGLEELPLGWDDGAVALDIEHVVAELQLLLDDWCQSTKIVTGDHVIVLREDMVHLNLVEGDKASLAAHSLDWDRLHGGGHGLGWALDCADHAEPEGVQSHREDLNVTTLLNIELGGDKSGEDAEVNVWVLNLLEVLADPGWDNNDLHLDELIET